MPPHEGVGGRGPLGPGLGPLEDLVPDPSPPGQPRVKCVLVGDGAIGKTSLVVSYTTNGYPTEYVPTAFDNYAVVVTVDNKPIRLQLCDTAGQDDFDELRPLCYPNTDVFLLCYSVVSPTSYHNITDKWLPEIRRFDPAAPIILVGTQCDLRNDVKVLIELANYNEQPVTEAQGQEKARVCRANAYIECSALTQKNLKEVFDNAILAALNKKGLIEPRRGASKRAKKYKCRADMWSSSQPASSHHQSATSEPSKSKEKKGWKKLCCFS